MLSLRITTKLLKFVKNKSKSNFVTTRTKCSKAMDEIKERKIRVDEVDINYIEVGKGSHPVLLKPGSLGTIWTDFKPQIEHLDREKFTVIAWDPPGQGKSRPPDKNFSTNFLQRDADWAHNLMKVLGYNKYSVVGWSNGGITGLILAAKYTDNIQKLVVSGTNSYISTKGTKLYTDYRAIDAWSYQMKKPMIAAYGEDYFRKAWTAWVDTLLKISEEQNGSLCNEILPAITCPTLIIYGEKDTMILREYAIYLKNNIKNSRLKYFENAGHNLHLKHYKKFNAVISEFLLNDSE